MTKPYRTLQEIIDIFSITLSTAKSIIKKYKVDTFTNKGFKVHVKDFNKAYTRYYNPSLFTKSDASGEGSRKKIICSIKNILC